MNQNQLTGVIRTLVGMATAWAMAKGYITSETAGEIITAAVAVSLAIWSFLNNTQTAMIKSVNNADNGVKVVAAAAPAAQVNAPLK